MKKSSVIALIAAIALVAVAVVTCPDREDHKEAIMSVVNEDANELSGGDNFLNFITSIGAGIMGNRIDSRLDVKNIFLFSIGEIHLPDDSSKTVSVGVFGHVFTIGREKMDEVLNEIR